LAAKCARKRKPLTKGSCIDRYLKDDVNGAARPLIADIQFLESWTGVSLSSCH
jgi:hypothetical protein